MNNRFDLDIALSAWRRSLTYNPAFDAVDLDELERHVRDQVEALARRGLDEEEAFHRALREMGSYGAVEAEYRKVYWGKRRRRGEVLHELIWRTSMLKNYAKIALRTLLRQKGYTFINVSGFAIGMACCLLILLLVRHEWSYDDFHEQGDRLYRVYASYESPEGEPNVQPMMTPGFADNLTAAFPQIEQATRYVTRYYDLTVGDRIYQQQLMEADPPFFSMFTSPFLAGDADAALMSPDAMVLTAKAASTLFPEASDYGEVLGRMVSITRGEDTYDFTVAGVVDDVPTNSSLVFDVAISFENIERLPSGMNNWTGETSTYVLLREGQLADALEARFPPFVETEFGDFMSTLRTYGNLAEGDGVFQLKLQPLRDLHLNPDVWVPFEAEPHNPLYSYILGGIGVLVLIIACINFMTLSVGRSASRAREVGLRKVLGAARAQVMRQFWGEAFVLSSVSLLLSVGLTLLALPAFNQLTGQSLSLWVLSGPEFVASIAALMLVVGLVAGGYPAVVLSRFQPAAVFKGVVQMRGNSWLTRSLVVVQYTISIGLIVATIIMGQQLTYLMNKDLGFEGEHVLAVHTTQVDRGQVLDVMERFRHRLMPHEGIVDMARTGSPFTRNYRNNVWQDASGQSRMAFDFGVDEHYLDVLDVELVAGRNFSPDFPSDPTTSVLVNEALVRELGLEDPVGQRLDNYMRGVFEEAPTIIGVVKDFNYRSLHLDVQPAVMIMHPRYFNLMNAMLIKVRPERVDETIRLVEAAWNEILPGKPFSYSFVDDDMDQEYRAEQRWSGIVQYASLFAVLIACLGLFGLATLTVTKRTKEIGIRKVLGASVPSIVSLVAAEFVKLVVIATVLAWPLAYVGMQEWLTGFAYRIGLSPWAFLGAGLVALLIALGTISYQAIKAALADPVKSLRYE